MPIWDQRSIFRQLVFFCEIALLRCRASGIDHYTCAYTSCLTFGAFLCAGTPRGMPKKKNPCPKNLRWYGGGTSNHCGGKEVSIHLVPGNQQRKTTCSVFPDFPPRINKSRARRISCCYPFPDPEFSLEVVTHVTAFEWDQKDCNFKLFMKFCELLVRVDQDGPPATAAHITGTVFQPFVEPPPKSGKWHQCFFIPA